MEHSDNIWVLGDFRLGAQTGLFLFLYVKGLRSSLNIMSLVAVKKKKK